MRAPPPVEYTSAPGRAWRTALATLVAGAAALPIAWGLPYVSSRWGRLRPDGFLQALANPAAQGAIVAWMAFMAFAAFWLSSGRGMARQRILRWDGQDWLIPGGSLGPDQRGTAALMLDLGPWLLVRFLPYGGGVGSASWLPLTLAGDLSRWAALRGALWTWRGNAPRRA